MIRVFSPAKVNLFLKVLSKRPDGYHELETLFERLSLGDTLMIRRAPKLRFRTDGQKIPTGSANLVMKAANLLKERYRVKQGADLYLKKRIPVAAGLGGGSSNAAATLVGLNRFWKLGLSKRKLLSLAAELGSDVPFFILDKAYAIGAGRGERLKPLSGGPRLWHCLVKPPFGISTKEAYAALGGRFLTHPGADVRMLVRLLRTGDREGLSKHLINSLELALNKRVTDISKIKKALLETGAFAALMSGSGSTVFGLYQSEKAAMHGAGQLRKKSKRWKVFIASTY